MKQSDRLIVVLPQQRITEKIPRLRFGLFFPGTDHFGPQYPDEYHSDGQQDIAQHPGAAAQEGALPIRDAIAQELKIAGIRFGLFPGRCPSLKNLFCGGPQYSVCSVCHHDHMIGHPGSHCNPDGIPVPERYITESCT